MSDIHAEMEKRRAARRREQLAVQARQRAKEAGPELLTAAKLLLALAALKYGNLDADANSVFEIARSAIAKAEG